jgi:hypothetical protein
MSTKVASIVVAGLKVPTKWLDHFVVECYADQALTTLVSRDTSTAVWDGANSVQHSLVVFSGLVLGNTYYIRAGAVTPITGQINWSSPFAEVAGTDSPPTNTWRITPSVPLGYTAAGILVPLQATNVGLDNDHYEASWTYDGSTPSDSSVPMWKGQADANNNLWVNVPVQSGQQVWLYMRTVNGAQQASSWSLILGGPMAGGTIDNVADGPTYSRVLGTAVESGKVNLMLDGVIQNGSIGPVWHNPGDMTYVASTNASGVSTVTFYYDGTNGSSTLKIYKSDGSLVSPPASRAAAGALSASTSYYFYPYYDEASGVVWFVSGGSFAVGTGPPIGSFAYTQPNYPAAQQQGGKTRIPLTSGSFAVSTPAPSSTGSGGGGFGGGGGGFGNCLRHTMYVESRERGIVQLGTCTVGEWIRGRNDWTQIVALDLIWWTNGFIRIGLRESGYIQATPTHPFTVPSETGESTKQCADLTLSDCLFVRHDANTLGQIVSLSLALDETGKPVKDYKAKITCYPEHEFWAGEVSPNILAHNVMLPC